MWGNPQDGVSLCPCKLCDYRPVHVSNVKVAERAQPRYGPAVAMVHGQAGASDTRDLKTGSTGCGCQDERLTLPQKVQLMKQTRISKRQRAVLIEAERLRKLTCR